MDAREFEKDYKALLSSYRDEGANPQSFEVKNCRHCGSCMFCKNCDACYRCNYCEGCEYCSECTHSKGCTNCHNSAYCEHCTNCVGSKYLEHCEACADCSYCFGCVGLVHKDFHILNKPYGRIEYFEIVAKLRKAVAKGRR